MKKCEYCAKEISYHEMYCGDECERLALLQHEKEEKFARLFSFVNIVCIFGITVGLFLFSISRLFGGALAIICCTVLGIMLLFLPFPTDSMKRKFKIKKAANICRLVGLGMFVLAMLIGGLIIFIP